MSLTGDSLFISPLSAELDDFDEFGADVDYLDGDNSFDFEDADLGGDMIGALPGSGAEQHDKRKSPDENTDAEGGDAKRQETVDGAKSAKKSKKRGSQGEEGDTVAKKPGRKPLTNEPTTKRKAQNRAAQRAFRERKEKHLKDLETKVNELTKSSDADKHENGLLRAQVDRLQTELREYRKRLSLNGASGQNRSPTLGGQQRSNSGSTGQFSFDFPKFGALPGNLMFGNQASNNGVVKRESQTPPTAHSSRHNSQARSMSPAEITSAITPQSTSSSIPNVGFSTIDNMHGFAGTLPQMGSSDPFSDLFSPSVLKGASFDGNNYFGDMNQAHARKTVANGVDNTATFSNVPHFTSGSSISDSASPSGSSTSQWHANGASSSCGTSPEPLTDSPNIKDFSMPQGSQLRNSISQAEPMAQDTIFNPTDFSVPSASTFDPTLFGDYRDTSMDTLFGTDLNGGLYDETLSAPFDMGSPSTLFGILQSPQTNTTSLPATNVSSTAQSKPCEQLMAQMEKAREGGDDDYGLPSTKTTASTDKAKLISCNNIWNQLQSNPDFQEGKFDLDGLCSELRTKARCSESGVLVDKDHVDAALRKLGNKIVTHRESAGSPDLMFPQESWDNVLKKMNGQA